MGFAQRILILRLTLITAAGLVVFFSLRDGKPDYVWIALATGVAIYLERVIHRKWLDRAWSDLGFVREISAYEEWDELIKYFESYVPRTKEERISLNTERGLWELQRGDQAKGKALLQSTLDESPPGSPFKNLRKNNVAWALVTMGDFEAAEKLAREALKASEAEQDTVVVPFASGTLGSALVGLGRAEEAVPLLKRAVELGADFPRAQATRYFFLGEAYTALGKNADARNAYREGHEVDPRSEHGAKCKERLNRPQ